MTLVLQKRRANETHDHSIRLIKDNGAFQFQRLGYILRGAETNRKQLSKLW